MSKHVNYDWSSLSQNLIEIQKINQKAAEELAREYTSLCSEGVGTAFSLAQMPRTNPEDFAKDVASTQLKLFTRQGNLLLESAQTMFNICQKALKEQLAWAEGQLDTASSVVQSSVAKVKKEHAPS